VKRTAVKRGNINRRECTRQVSEYGIRFITALNLSSSENDLDSPYLVIYLECRLGPNP